MLDSFQYNSSYTFYQMYHVNNSYRQTAQRDSHVYIYQSPNHKYFARSQMDTFGYIMHRSSQVHIQSICHLINILYSGLDTLNHT